MLHKSFDVALEKIVVIKLTMMTMIMIMKIVMVKVMIK